jgi:hypothetical protein
MALHVDAAPAECYAFAFQTEALFDSRIATQLNFSSCAKHPVPGQPEGAP